MERAFVAAWRRRPDLSGEDVFIALLLLKDRILERHIRPEDLAPELRSLARELYEI